MNNNQTGSPAPPTGYGFVPPASSPPSYDAATVMSKSPQATTGMPQPTIYIPGPQAGGNSFYPPSSPSQPIMAQPTSTQFQPAMSQIGPDPGHLRCPSCQTEILTKVETLPGLLSYVSGAILCVAGCFCGCCLIPCALSDCKDVAHYCPNPNCKAFLGRYRRHLGLLRYHRNRRNSRRRRSEAAQQN